MLDGIDLEKSSAAIGFLCMAIRPVLRFFMKKSPAFDPTKAVRDLSNGAALLPFFAMAICVFDHEAIVKLIVSSSWPITLAGTGAFFFAVKELDLLDP